MNEIKKTGLSDSTINAGLVLLLVLLTGFSFLMLDADYSPMRRWGDCGDEGFWIHNARMKILFGTYGVDEFNQTTYGAPVFNYLTWLSFRCFGISLYSARLVSLLAFLLTLTVLFLLLRKKFDLRTTLLYCLFLLVSHEIMMYYAWATPIFLEVFFYLLILLVYERADRMNEYLKAMLIVLLLAAAVFSKISSLYFSIPLLFFGAREWLVTRRITYRFALSFGITCIAVFLVYYLFYYRVHKAGIQQFLHGVAYSNIKTIQEILKAIFIVPFNIAIFKYPSVIVLFILAVFRMIDLLRRHKYQFWKTIRLMDTVELYCICWIFGSIVSLSFTGEVGFDRRMIYLYFPFSILSLYYVREVLGSPKEKTETGSLQPRTWLKWILFAALSIYFFFYFYTIPKNRLFFFVLGMNKSLVYYFFAASLVLTLCYHFCFKRQKHTLVYIALAYFIISSCTLNCIWFFNRSYSIKEMNEKIEKLPPGPNKYLYGMNAHLYAINNSEIIPIWYRNPPMGKIQINEWFDGYADTSAYLYIRVDSVAGNNNTFLRRNEVDYIKQVDDERVEQVLGKMRIAPFPFVNIARLNAELVQVKAEPAGKK